MIPRAQGRVGPQKITINARTGLEEAFTKLGGVAGLVRWGRKNRTEFYKIWARLIPRDVTLGAGEGLEELLTKLAEARGSQPGDNARLVEGQVIEP